MSGCVCYSCGCGIEQSMFGVCQVLSVRHCEKHHHLFSDEKSLKQMANEIRETMTCPVEQYCEGKGCQNSLNQWMTESNCTCQGCLGRSEHKECDLSGDAYNTDGDCLASK